MVKIAPSILAADFANLAADVARVADEVELLHVDCMDGHYVPNLTIGPPVVAALRPHTDRFLDCHLMVDNPGRLMAAFADAGADGLSVHVELGDTAALLAQIAALGLRRGLAFEPQTPYDAVEPFLADIDVLLVMSVHTGYGGQPFIPDVLDKVRAARAEIDTRGLHVEIEIDGGIKASNAGQAAGAGVDILVSGTGIFGTDDPVTAVRAIRAASS
ncbi:MAG TPA: ribulose-phosphate 3-epimerase [Acidimicrobiia bacterium]|jgi:ribulose-phosphate 3-epimerase|nr:ribulose-phosphate 3-epimerase [Acidimicrobiia bacterium]